MKRIIVVEGPSGSGKSTLINRLSTILPASIISTPWITRPRSYDGNQGEVMAMTKDMASFATALATPGDCLIDRWVLSSWVYNRIRQPLNMDIRDLSCMIKTSADMVDIAEHQLIHRGVLKETELGCQRYLLLLPSVSEIEKRRAGAGREFPYSATEERFLFMEIADKLNNIPVLDGNENDLELYLAVSSTFPVVEDEQHERSGN